MPKRSAGVTIKVGISRISVAFHQQGKIVRIRTCPTPTTDHETSLRSFFTLLWMDLPPQDLEAVLVCVVPDLKNLVKALWIERSQQSVVDFSLERSRLIVDYHPPEGLGNDRIAAAWGAFDRLENRVGSSFVIADFGTHTVLTVCQERHLLGGAILPGIHLMARCIGAGRVTLIDEAHLLTKDKIISGKAIGSSTEEGIFSGVVMGSVEAVLGLRKNAEDELGEHLPMILTGGLAYFIAPLFPSGVHINRQLLHYGAWRFLAEN